MKQIILIIFLSCYSLSLFSQNQQAPQLDEKTKSIVYNALNNYYVFPDTANSMCNYIKQQNEKGKYDMLTNPNDFAGQIVKDMRSVYNDIHLRIEYNSQLEKELLKFLSSKQSANKVTEMDIVKDEKQNFYFKKLEILPSNIGFIEFTGFANPSPSAIE